MTDQELLQQYHDTLVPSDEFRELVNDRPCIIFSRVNGKTTVNIDESLKLIRFAMKQQTAERSMIDGKIIRVYRIGEFPQTPPP